MKKISINLLISLITMLLMLGIIEIVLGLIYPTTETYTTPDPILGWRLKENAETIVKTPEYNILVNINSHGWRDVEHTYKKEQGTFRVLVLGDSFMEGYGVPLENIFSQQLNKNLATYKQVEVINFGVGGYGTLQSYLAYLEHGIKYDPDIVLLAFLPANDIRNNSSVLEAALEGNNSTSYLSRPFLEASLDNNWKIIEPEIKRVEERLKKRESIHPLKKTLIYSKVRSMWKAWIKKQDVIQNASDYKHEKIWKGNYLCQENKLYREAWDITERIFVQLNYQVQKNNAELIVMTVPSMLEVDEDYINNTLKTFNKPDDFCFKSHPAVARTIDILKKQHISYIDLLPNFLQGVQSGQTLFHPQDTHWNSEGHKLAAKIVADVMSLH